MAKKAVLDDAHLRAIPLDSIGDRLLRLLDNDDENAVADAVDLLISQGAYHNASDVHLEPWQDYVSLRYRIDGMLHQAALLPRTHHSKLVARIKVLSELIVYRRDVPQDGRIDHIKTSCGRPLRVSIIPTVKGENTVLRLLGETAHSYTLETLGFAPHVVAKLREILVRAQGTMLLTGPSSAGKTTTIYTLLRELLRLQQYTSSIVTIEDPVENSMDKVVQIQVNPHVDFTFATALRNILRQDPEVIMVGEIRDQETARIAVQAGLTGHFVISTIHSGTAAGVYTRLLDMGIEPFLVASSVTAVLAQRLVRLNCPACAENYTPDAVVRERFKTNGASSSYVRGKGCEACQDIGYRGRAAIGELLQASQGFSEFVLTRPTTAQLHALAVAEKMGTLAEDGLAKVKKGITTLEELIRVLPSGPSAFEEI